MSSKTLTLLLKRANWPNLKSIDAVKLLRKTADISLKDAKEQIEDLIDKSGKNGHAEMEIIVSEEHDIHEIKHEFSKAGIEIH